MESHAHKPAQRDASAGLDVVIEVKGLPNKPTASPHVFADEGVRLRRRHPIPIAKTVLRELLRFSESKLIDFFHRLGNDGIVCAREKLLPYAAVDCDTLKGRGGPATFQGRRSIEIRHGLDVDGFRAQARNSQIAVLRRFDRKRMLSIARGPNPGPLRRPPQGRNDPKEPKSFALLLKQPQTRFVIVPENFMTNTQSLHRRHQMTVSSTFVVSPSPTQTSP
ncbi:hypothetical protein HMPREF0972_02644 [Actinomyces sp. oral taxon 848 str. F0332]|nr:hypothetical protein HMPREF0972_02644 [Actinomyces sp. oral taxon 848 str. F0332]